MRPRRPQAAALIIASVGVVALLAYAIKQLLFPYMPSHPMSRSEVAKLSQRAGVPFPPHWHGILAVVQPNVAAGEGSFWLGGAGQAHWDTYAKYMVNLNDTQPNDSNYFIIEFNRQSNSSLPLTASVRRGLVELSDSFYDITIIDDGPNEWVHMASGKR